jgi:hypothetical protein
MKHVITALASAVCLLCSAGAHANVYKLSFTATNILSNDGKDTLQDPVSGSIVYSALPYESPTIDAIDLTIAGHVYTLDEVTAQVRSGGYVFGGMLTNVWDITSGHDDFYLNVLGRDEGFGYSVSGLPGSWTTHIVHSEVEQVASVPEPGSLALLLAGAAGLGTMLHRRRRPTRLLPA